MQADSIIRDAIPADAQAMAEIYSESVAAADCTMDESPRDAGHYRRAVEGRGEREALLVLVGGGALIGFAGLQPYSERSGYRFAGETATYLRRSHLRRGLGTHLERALIERSRALGYHHLVAKVYADNLASVEYNLRLGYELVGVQREVGFIDGRWKDVAVLQLVLDEAPDDPSRGSGEPAI